jgi:exoribonuclease II
MREGQVCPDGVVIDINWSAFEVGASVFIPAVNLTRLKKQMQILAKRKQMQIKGFDRIESGKLGMRFWRIL